MRFSRRDFVASATAAVAGTSVIGGPLRRARAQGTDTLRMGWGARGLRTIDPQKSIQGVDDWAILHIHDRLVQIPLGRFPDTMDEFRPGLATAWQGSADAMTWTFQLRQGVQFHKGFGEFTAEDVKHTFDRVRDADRIGVRRPMYDNIREVTVDGPYEVTFHLHQPDPLFLWSTQTHTTCAIISMRANEELGDEALERNPIGTGPYMLEEVHPDPADGCTVVANPDFWGEQPGTPRIQFTYIADTTARTLALLSGDVHMIEGVRAPGWVPSIQQRNPNLHFDVVAPGSFFTIHFNMTQAPFDNVLVRRAMFHAIDRDEITQAMAPFGGRTWGLNPPSYIGGFTAETIPEQVRYDYSPERAKELLAEAGLPDGFSFNAYTSQREDYSALMLMIQEQLRKAGITMNLEIKDHTAFHADQTMGTNTISQMSSTFPPVPTQPILLYLTSGATVIEGGGGGHNFSRYGVVTDGIDALYEKAMNEPDLAKRIALVQEIEVQFLRDAPMLPLVTNGFMVVRAANVDVGFDVISGYANWDLTHTVIG